MSAPSVVSAIEFDEVGVEYPGAARPAVDGVSFGVPAGELVVLLGPSGCGKTTLLKTVNRLVEPTSGRVLIDGEDVRDGPATELRRRIGYAIQATGLFPHMTVHDNISVVPRLLGWDATRTDDRVAEMLELVNLPRDYGTRYPRQLSGGEAQRVGIARALAADPAFLLMDEPFGAIDAINRSRLQEALLQIQARLRKTILFVTHDVDEAVRLADRIAVLRDGALVQYAPPLEILARSADEFVADLVSADDLFRQLSLLPVHAVMSPAATGAASRGAAAEHHLRPGSETDAPAGTAAETPTGTLAGTAAETPPGTGAGLPPDVPSVAADADLRSALTDLLRSGADSLPVLDVSGRLVGHLSLADVRKMSVSDAKVAD